MHAPNMLSNVFVQALCACQRIAGTSPWPRSRGPLAQLGKSQLSTEISARVSTLLNLGQGGVHPRISRISFSEYHPCSMVQLVLDLLDITFSSELKKTSCGASNQGQCQGQIRSSHVAVMHEQSFWKLASLSKLAIMLRFPVFHCSTTQSGACKSFLFFLNWHILFKRDFAARRSLSLDQRSVERLLMIGQLKPPTWPNTHK